MRASLGVERGYARRARDGQLILFRRQLLVHGACGRHSTLVRHQERRDRLRARVQCVCIAVKKKMRASPRSSAPSRRMDSSLARRRVRSKTAHVITDVAGRQIRPSRRRSRRRRGRHTSPARRIGARGDRVRCQPIANERARGGRSGPGVRGRSAAPRDSFFGSAALDPRSHAP